jgi:hypothetical protein
MNKKYSKELITHKINLNEHNDIKQQIHKVFSDPNFYFSSNLNGNRIIIGKNKPSKNIIPKIVSSRKSIFFYKSKGNPIRISPDKKNKISFLKNNNKDLIINDANKKYLDEEDLEEIYSKFEEISLENTLKNKKLNGKNLNEEFINDINNKLYKTVRTEYKHKLNFQEEVLNKKKKEEMKIKNIKKNLVKKIKRRESKLLINKSESYRKKKEIKDNIFKEIENYFQPNFNWIVSLRGDKDNHYINDGTDENPFWNIVIHKKENFQKIRNLNFLKTQHSFFKDNYLKKKLPFKNFDFLKKEIDDLNIDFSNMIIKGKKLLDFEKENSRNLKGKKYLVYNNPLINNNSIFNALTLVADKNVRNEIYKENFNPKEILRRKGRTISNFY